MKPYKQNLQLLTQTFGQPHESGTRLVWDAELAGGQLFGRKLIWERLELFPKGMLRGTYRLAGGAPTLYLRDGSVEIVGDVMFVSAENLALLVLRSYYALAGVAASWQEFIAGQGRGAAALQPLYASLLYWQSQGAARSRVATLRSGMHFDDDEKK